MIVEVLKRKGLCAKQDLYDIITEFRRKNPHASISEIAFPEPYLLTETENKIIDDIFAFPNKHGLTSYTPDCLFGFPSVYVSSLPPKGEWSFPVHEFNV